ncbi:hypothetical protein BDR03DRAFT_422994 [Suillus americanus]|nr:hypothetical protein BDR03DRAFT_422994 [Suillus americanus]
MVSLGLTFGQEVELVWTQRWSLITVLYLIVRYVGIGYAVINMLVSLPTISMTDAVSTIMYKSLNWTSKIVNVILGVIMITWLHAMYQRSRQVLIFLVVIFLAITSTNAVMLAIEMMQTSGEEFVLSGTYQCIFYHAVDVQLLYPMTWIPATVWEVVTPCLAVWIVVKYFRGLRRHSTRGIIGDRLTALMQIHVSYFASFWAISCFRVGLVSPTLSANGFSLAAQPYYGLTQIFLFVQLFVLGPRLIIGVRDYHAELVANSDTATTMPSIAFQERAHVSTSSSV